MDDVTIPRELFMRLVVNAQISEEEMVGALGNCEETWEGNGCVRWKGHDHNHYVYGEWKGNGCVRKWRVYWATERVNEDGS